LARSGSEGARGEPMTSVRRSIGAAAFLLGLSALPAAAATPQALAERDVVFYRAAFDAAERGDQAAAENALSQVSDRCLIGRVRYLELIRAPASDYQALVNWLTSFAGEPGAADVYRRALQAKPDGAEPPGVVAETADFSWRLASGAESKPARDAYYAGDLSRALGLARDAGDAWIAGLAAWRLGDYADALVSFETLAANSSESDEIRAAGGVWGARAALAAGAPDRVEWLLKIAAQTGSFYGMVARRALELTADPLGALIDESRRGEAPAPIAAKGASALESLVRTDERAHRAAALIQLGRAVDAGQELRAGLARAPDDGVRALWMGLMYELSPDRPASGEIELSAPTPSADGAAAYPAPPLNPSNGFIIDKALVYAVVWQESRFNSYAVSRVGARGLMQLMRPTAASMESAVTLATNQTTTLFDTGHNLALGQAYLAWLEENVADYDILRTLAAYNAGPTALQRTEALAGAVDSLTLIECLPEAETRTYVKKVMAAYWSYRRQFGEPTRTLDALASFKPGIDARLDPPLLAPPPAPVAPTASGTLQDVQAAPQPADDPLEILLRHAG
jgi:soluble lytic murein transglycosylase-like protein